MLTAEPQSWIPCSHSLFKELAEISAGSRPEHRFHTVRNLGTGIAENIEGRFT